MCAQIGQPRRIGDIGLTTGHIARRLGVDQHHVQPVFEQVIKRLPVVRRGFDHHTADLLGDQMLTQRQDLAGGRPPRAHRRRGAPPTLTLNPDTHLGVLLGDINARTPRMNNLHDPSPFPSRTIVVARVSGRAKTRQESLSRAHRQQSTAPAQPQGCSPLPSCSPYSPATQTQRGPTETPHSASTQPVSAKQPATTATKPNAKDQFSSPTAGRSTLDSCSPLTSRVQNTPVVRRR